MIGERRREAMDLNDLGLLWCDIGGYAKARECCEQALAIQAEIGDPRNASFTSLNLGWLLLDEAPTRSGELYERALSHALASGDREGRPTPAAISRIWPSVRVSLSRPSAASVRPWRSASCWRRPPPRWRWDAAGCS